MPGQKLHKSNLYLTDIPQEFPSMLRNSKGDSEGVASDLRGEPDKDNILEAK